MTKIGWLVIILFVAAAMYTLLSVFAPTGEVDTASGLVLSVGPEHFWFAGSQGFSRVATTKGSCVSVPAGIVQSQDWIEVRAKVTDSFQMSVCDAPDGYVSVHDTVYPIRTNESTP